MVEIRDNETANRHQLGAHQPPGVHDGSRQQRPRRPQASQHGRRSVSVHLRRNCVLAQRRCATSATTAAGEGLAPAAWKESALDPAPNTRTCSTKAWAASGAAAPAQGRTAICELLDLNGIHEMILEKRPTSEIKKAAREEGMRFLRVGSGAGARRSHHLAG
jgi:type II secretory ATPase GspE/PulE/Tfp pilus assembly ATPase PilB-like protein